MDALRDASYSIVSHSPLTGANVFSLQRNSFMVFHQGHPEYDSDTLLREYRRDVMRFLSGTQANYPTIPKGYFSDSATQRLMTFKDEAIALRSPALASRFPFEAEARELKHTWKPASTVLYENWLSYIADARCLGQKSEPKT
jgi:homoserine O-succinyltransferase